MVARLRAGRPDFDSRHGHGFLSLCHHVQTDSGAHPASYTMGTGVYFLGRKSAGAWSWSLISV